MLTIEKRTVERPMPQWSIMSPAGMQVKMGKTL
jgi:hypothetical protein